MQVGRMSGRNHSQANEVNMLSLLSVRGPHLLPGVVVRRKSDTITSVQIHLLNCERVQNSKTAWSHVRYGTRSARAP